MSSFSGNGFSFPLGSRSYVMGILNVTPDSFSDGGRYSDVNSAVRRALQIESEGGDIIDIGAVSTRPGHPSVSRSEELSRLAPVLEGLHGRLTTPVSVDTSSPFVADYALTNGAQIVNDVSGSLNAEMAEVVRRHRGGWIITHNGRISGDYLPASANAATKAEKDGEKIVADVSDFFDRALLFCRELGLGSEQLCLDVGFGFGKNYSEDMMLLRSLGSVKREGVALMAALSRKRMIGQATGRDVGERLAGTVAANAIALFSGADFIRVHDVRQGVDTVRLAAAASDAVGI